MSQLKASSIPKAQESLPGRCLNNRLARRIDNITRVIILLLFYVKMFISCSLYRPEKCYPVYQAIMNNNLREKPGTDRALSNFALCHCAHCASRSGIS
jgi:hypothetical protein